jgi:hypothetical protein
VDAVGVVAVVLGELDVLVDQVADRVARGGVELREDVLEVAGILPTNACDR